MREKFSYDTSAKVFRRKTLTNFQKFLMLLLIVGDTVVSIFAVMHFAEGENASQFLVIVSAIAPTIITLIALIYIGLHPRGPEQDFILPGAEIDADDWATVTGTVKLQDKTLKEVEVKVPNVYGGISLNLLSDTPDVNSSGEISTPEMFEMALETVCRKYPESIWESGPKLVG